MAEYEIRKLRGLEDAGPQYQLWLNATDGLPRAWRSSLVNVRHQLQNAVRYPGSRLYAETQDGALLGYIGCHEPFQWEPAKHGPPSEDLGWTIPFGMPWTFPMNESLAAELYLRLTESIPDMFGEFQRDLYIQRFRQSWHHQLDFLQSRGWLQIASVPLIGIRTSGSFTIEDVRPATRDDLELASELSQLDVIAETPWSLDELIRRYDAGWIAPENMYVVGDYGFFVLEQRGRQAAVTVMFAVPQMWENVVDQIRTTAAKQLAEEIYLTVETHRSSLTKRLHGYGFRDVDAGIYLVAEAD